MGMKMERVPRLVTRQLEIVVDFLAVGGCQCGNERRKAN